MPDAPAPPPPRERFDVEVEGGATIRVRRHGNPDAGRRLFLSHGNGLAIDGYYPFWQALEPDFDLVVFDARSHGRNPPSDPAGYDHARVGRDIDRVRRAAADRLGEKPGSGVFHSMSAAGAMQHALAAGWHWRALVLFDPPNVLPDPHPAQEAMDAHSEQMARVAALRRDRFANPRDLAALLERAPALRRWIPGAHALMARSVLCPDEEGNGWRLVCPRALEAHMYLDSVRMRPWPPAAEIGGPVLLVIPDPTPGDAPPTAAVNGVVAETLGYRCAVIPESGHMLQIEKPAAAAAATLEFLVEHAG